MASMTCDIVTPVKKLFGEDCYMVVVPGVEGNMGFLPGHAQLMSTLADGVVRVYSDANTVSSTYALQGGYVQVTGEKVIVLADRAVPVESIDLEAVRAQIAETEEAIKAESDEAAKALAEADLAWYKVQEHAASENAAA